MMSMNESSTDAERFKLLGNKALADNKLVEAAEFYVKAHELDSKNAVYASNLSVCHMKMGDFEIALHWAKAAIEADPKFIKGYYRRAMASLKLLKLQEAKADLLMLSKVNPTDADVKIHLDKCNALLREKAFLDAIHVEGSSFDLAFVNSIVIPPSYDGIVLSEPITLEYIKEMISRFKNYKLIDKKSALLIMLRAKELFEKQPTLININVPKDSIITVCGDVHGQFFDFMQIFDSVSGFPSEKHFYLFNGDFVDRGPCSLEIALVLFAFKVLFPDQFFISRGNHEFSSMNKIYGFEKEVVRKYDDVTFSLFLQVFSALPICHVINEKIFVTHGGLHSNPNVSLQEINKINRFGSVEPGSLFESLLWSDPSDSPGIGPSERGAGVNFGPDITHKFLANNNLEYIIRSHQHAPNGYKVAHDGKLITIFSAPNYYHVGNDPAAVIEIDSDCKMTFKEFSQAR